MSTVSATSPAQDGPAVATPGPDIEERTPAKAIVRPGDRIFTGLSKGSAIFVTVVIAGIASFLMWRAIPAIGNNEVNFLTYAGTWSTGNTSSMTFGVLDLFYTTVYVSVFALLLAMPVALAIAIFLTQYAPRRLAKPIAYLIDLLAAVPSIVYGLWGVLVLGPALAPIARWLNDNVSWLPFFAGDHLDANIATGRTLFTAGVVLAVMILPIITAVSREVFTQTPKGHIEAALALGATRWEVVRTAVLPFGLSGYISGSMLGLGRALGETMALYLIISGAGVMNWSLFESGQTFATKIALAAAEFDHPLSTGAYIAAGLVLFVLTFVVNAAARAVVSRKG